MKITDYLKENVVYLDGAMGTLLQERGLMPGELPEVWNVTHAQTVKDIHKSYFDAGSNVVVTNTFGANSFKFSPEELDNIIGAAVMNARLAAKESFGRQEKWVALDIGPTGKMLKPYGELDFEDAVSVFAEVVRLGAKHGADLIFIETMSDSYEAKAALLAAKENCALPVFVSCAFGEDGRLMTGADPYAAVAMLEGLGADAVGINCSFGPGMLACVAEKYLECASVPVLFKPNAGIPKEAGGKTVYDISPGEFAEQTAELVRRGVRIVGGCCGTTPDYIAEVVGMCRDITPPPLLKKSITWVSSYTHAVIFGTTPVLIGERINPTGKARFKEALFAQDLNYILSEGISQQQAGADVLDVNVGLPEIDEPAMMQRVVCELQGVIDLPLQIDTSDPFAMERALRLYNGKAMINSVSGKRESMEAVFPLAKKYGGVIVALTLDENGIPSTAEGRVQIAKKILSEAKKYGIDKKDIVFDPLALTVSADRYAAAETLKAVELLHEGLGVHTSLGVSNVSFGLPQRDKINGTFFAMALDRGLSCAIVNPLSEELMKAYYTYLALSGLDESCGRYIAYTQRHSDAPVKQEANANKTEQGGTDEALLRGAIIRGLKEKAASLAEAELLCKEPLDIVQSEIIPALNEVGEGYENGKIYLPGLLMSAEAAGAAFEVIKAKSSVKKSRREGCPVVLATVKGDIHDIGKNIVKLILENYGFEVYDLGKDVSPEAIACEVKEKGAGLVGLSALMTTTVPAMAETIRLLRRQCPFAKIMVGGAVLTQEYAEDIGADFYAKDAMDAVRYAERAAVK